MKGWLQLISAVLLIVALICLPIWWKAYKYKDCRKVGHSALYCAVRIFE